MVLRVTNRVHAHPQTASLPGLEELRHRGVARRIWTLDRRPWFETFFDFSRLPAASRIRDEPGIVEPVLRVGEYRSRSHEDTQPRPGRPVFVGTESGTIRLTTSTGPVLLTWNAATLERLGEAEIRAQHAGRGALPGRHEALFQDFVAEVIAIEPRLADPRREGRYFWRERLQAMADYELADSSYPFPWRPVPSTPGS